MMEKQPEWSEDVPMAAEEESPATEEEKETPKKPAKKKTPKKKEPEPRAEAEVEEVEEDEEHGGGGKGNGDYFWKKSLHDEFMRHFTVWGKTWKIVSQKMQDNGIFDKD